jgi:hypothetical protein
MTIASTLQRLRSLLSRPAPSFSEWKTARFPFFGLIFGVAATLAGVAIGVLIDQGFGKVV